MVAGNAFRVVVLGGYGTFGTRISRALAQDAHLAVVVCGRNPARAAALVRELQRCRAPATLESATLDTGQADLADALRDLGAQLVIHTCGPFQGQDYAVARACIEAGAHYLDLADSRSFVEGFTTLDRAAKAAGVLALTGASSVPALAGAVIDDLLPAFSELHSIDHGINPGNRTARGLATVESILSYCGRPIRQWKDARWQQVYGWQGLIRRDYPPPMGRRWLGYCDVPDLTLFPARYPGVRTVVFRAGLELPLLHLGTWALSWLSRARLVDNWRRHAAVLKRISEAFGHWGSQRGGMHVELQGLDHGGKPLQRCWYLFADSDDGPQIPCTAAVVVCKKLAHGEIGTRGAGPCLGYFSRDAFMQELSGYDVHERMPGPPIATAG